MSSESGSDDEYVPGEPEQLSEVSTDEETDLQKIKEPNKTNKRKSKRSRKGKKRLKAKEDTNEIDDTKEVDNIKEIGKTEEEVNVDPDEEKKREEDLWAKFLEGTDTKPKPTIKDSNISTQPLEKSQEPSKKDNVSNIVKEDQKERDRRIFEFAGETIVVENNVIKEKIKTAESETAATGSKSIATPSSRRGGLSNVLGQLNKKNKLTTLEKTKLDWDTYKREEDIEDEIVSHNKGKAGFLDRRDFLERTDVRQYEIERSLRMSRRSNR